MTFCKGQQINRTYIKTSMIQPLVNLIVPKLCIHCSVDLQPNDHQLCTLCMGKLPYTVFEKIPNNPMFERLHSFHKITQANALLFYNDHNITKVLLHEFKYRKNIKLGQLLARVLQTRYAATCQAADYIIPVPLHFSKKWQRGFNQSEILAQGLSEVSETPIYDAVRRNKRNRAQAKQSRQNRWANTSSLFKLQREAQMLLQEKHIVVVDDVFTTGATLIAFLDCLKQCEYASCQVLTLAYSENH